MAVYTLSVPPSANALFVAARNGRRYKTAAYKSWIRGELKALLAQRAKPVDYRATVTITLPKGRGDVDGKIKATLDLLVRAAVLKDDAPAYVASVTATYGDVPMMEVEITPGGERP